MGYHEAMEAAGAQVLAFESFGSYQGDWFAKVVFEGRTFWVHGCFGSCSGCDAFQAEFDYDEGKTCSEHRYEDGTPEQLACEECKQAAPKYQQKLAEFGRSYLNHDMTQDEAEKYASQNLEWDSDASEMLTFVQTNKL